MLGGIVLLVNLHSSVWGKAFMVATLARSAVEAVERVAFRKYILIVLRL
jgi:hypothetical protein